MKNLSINGYFFTLITVPQNILTVDHRFCKYTSCFVWNNMNLPTLNNKQALKPLFRSSDMGNITCTELRTRKKM